MWIVWTGLAIAVVVVVVHDLTQKRHAILRNFPLIGHFRYWLEAVGPELRQYIVTSNDEERPFSRDQRRWVYASAKKENNYFGFGTDNDLERSTNYAIVKHRTLAPVAPAALSDPLHPLPAAKILGAARGRRRAFRPSSVIQVSGMSFGSLSGPAIESINRGCKIADCLHNTGEGGVSKHHLHGGDLIWQIGTGYFGCRGEGANEGRFDLARFKETVAADSVRAIEIKLSQGAKPGLGGILPAAKITAEISAARGIPRGVDCLSPSGHTAFRDTDGLLDFVELLAEESGVPVGIKSAVGEGEFWSELAELMAAGDRGVDFITVDGGEGGTGAGPLAFSDHVALPFKLGFARVFSEFAKRGLDGDVVFIGSGKLGFPADAMVAFSLGCDLIAVGREAMLAIGCIQAQRCHTGHCPTGVATQNRWLVRGLDPTHKAARLANYIITLRKEVLQLCVACGVCHPALLSADDLEILDDRFGSKTPRELFQYEEGWGLPNDARRAEIESLSGLCDGESSAPNSASAE